MTELLEKLKFKPTIKQVITGILTALLLVVFWEQGHELLIQFKVPNEYASELYIPLIFLISYLLAGLGLKCITSFNKDRAIKTKNNEFRTVVQKTLPQLPTNHLEILKELSREEQNLSLRRKGVSPLNKQNYIKKIHQTSLNEFIFKINPIVKNELDIFIKNEQNTNLKKLILDISKHERQFLGLFFSDKVSSGTQESGVIMEHAIYLASESLLQKKILKRISGKPNSHIAILELEPDAIKTLEQSIFQKTAKRHTLELNLNHIASSGLSGGSAYNRHK